MNHHPQHRGRHGLATVEAALVLPLVFLLVLGMIDFGMMFHTLHTMTNAARDGARQLAVRDGTPAQAAALARNRLAGIHAAFTVTATEPAVDDPSRDVTVRISVPRSDISWGVAGVTWKDPCVVEVKMRKEEG